MTFEHSSLTFALNNSTKPFRQGSLGGMNTRSVSLAHSATALLMSSGALSMRSAFAIPWPMANGQFVGLFGEVKTGNCVVDDSSQTFPGVFVHDGEDIERFTRNDQIELEIDGPHVTFFLSNHCWGCQPTNSLPTPFHDYPKSYFSPEALNHLVMDLPAVPASIHLGPPIPPPGMAAGIVTQPSSQSPVWVVRRISLWSRRKADRFSPTRRQASYSLPSNVLMT